MIGVELVYLYILVLLHVDHHFWHTVVDRTPVSKFENGSAPLATTTPLAVARGHVSPTAGPSPKICDLFSEDAMSSSLQEEFVFNQSKLITMKNYCFAQQRPNSTQREKNVVFVLSHRRSGTHATVSLLQENFPGVTVIKGGHLILDQSVKNGCKQLQEMRAVGHLLYVFRNPMDVMVSLHAYIEFIRKNVKPSFYKTTNMSEFILDKTSIFPPHRPFSANFTRLHHWKFHLFSWALQPQVAFISFENVTKNPEFAVNTIATLFGLKRKKGVATAPKPGSHTVVFRGGKSSEQEIDVAGRDAGYRNLRQPIVFNETLLTHCQPLDPSKLPSLQQFIGKAKQDYNFDVIKPKHI
jgi:hypothetical protein